jgi:thioredoxin 1
MFKNTINIVLIISAMFFITCKSEKHESAGLKSEKGSEVSSLSNELFKKLIFNYDSGNAWGNISGKPVLIDFYAVWCVPCRKLSPVIEELAKEYSGKIVVYKVDIDKERELAEKMRITAIPSLMFIPVIGKPSISRGLVAKEDLVKAINDLLLIK